jgi:putative addiction module killer protein
MFEVRQTEQYKTWFKALKDRKARAAINARIRRFALGSPGDVAPVGEGVSEFRIHLGPGYRVYYVQAGKEIILLLCGGEKSTQDKDIRAAKIMASDLKG